MNQVTVNFNPCSPAPVNGYQVLWRVKGSTDVYTSAGNFTSSPAVFTDATNPDGTQYEGLIRSDCGTFFGQSFYWTTNVDNSSCGTFISNTASGNFYSAETHYLHVEGATQVFVIWEAYDRPNRFNLYDNGVMIATSGWRGTAPYPGPWGASLPANISSGSFTFTPLLGHEYKLIIEVGPSGPAPYDKSDNFMVNIACV